MIKAPSMKTIVLGASPNPSRHSHRVTIMLLQQGYEVVPMGIRKGRIVDNDIVDLRSQPTIENVHTITLYLSVANQQSWYQYILDLNPLRIIFNPGTENPELRKMAKEKGIATEEACTLVMLTVDTY